MSARLSELLGEYAPARWLRGPHVQTLIGCLAGPWPSVPRATKVTVELPDGDRLIALENRPTNTQTPRGAVLLLHGLAIDAEATYVRRAAASFLDRGYITFRLNLRGAGAGAGLAKRLYHSGVTDELAAALELMATRYAGLPVVAVGYSMSGGTLLKLLGERGPEADGLLAGAVAFNPPIDLQAVEANMGDWRNGFYVRSFCRLLSDQVFVNDLRGGRQRAWPSTPVRTLREFDLLVTCPDWGFASPEDYYLRASCKVMLPLITVPTLIVADEDDPIVPFHQWDGVPYSKHVDLLVTKGGGHMGYVAEQPTPAGHRRWIDHALITAVDKFAAAG